MAHILLSDLPYTRAQGRQKADQVKLKGKGRMKNSRRLLQLAIGMVSIAGCAPDNTTGGSAARQAWLGESSFHAEDKVQLDAIVDAACLLEGPRKVHIVLPDGRETTENQTQIRLRVSLGLRPRGVVVITPSSTDKSEGLPSGALEFFPSNWNKPQEIVVTGQPDGLVDRDQPYAITFKVVAPWDKAYDHLKVPPIELVNRDREMARLVLSPRGPLTTTEHGGEAIVDVALSARPRTDVEVVVGISDATEAVASPTSIVFTPHNWHTNQAISVRGVGDLLADGTVSYDVTFSAASADSAYAHLPTARLSFENQDQAAFSGIGDLAGGDYASAAFGVNADGTVVVGHSVAGLGRQAVRWTADVGLLSLGGASSAAWAIDDSGQTIVGEAIVSPSPGDAVVWMDAQGPTALPRQYMGPADRSSAEVISGDGQVIDGEMWQSGAFGPAGLAWHSLGLPSIVPYIAKGSSHDGSVIVGYGGYSRPYTTHFALRGVERLPYATLCITPVLCDSEAAGVDSDGVLAVGHSYDPQDGRTRATLWDVTAGTVATLSSQQEAKALGISGDGKVIVGYQVYERAIAMRWMNGTERKILDLLSEASVAMTGWTLTIAHAASRDGRVIVGEGINPNGLPEGWIAILPP